MPLSSTKLAPTDFTLSADLNAPDSTLKRLPTSELKGTIPKASPLVCIFPSETTNEELPYGTVNSMKSTATGAEKARCNTLVI